MEVFGSAPLQHCILYLVYYIYCILYLVVGDPGWWVGAPLQSTQYFGVERFVVLLL